MDVVNDSIANYLSSLGIQGTDPGATARPVRRTPLTRTEIETLYEQTDVATRGIDELVEDALKEGSFEVFASEDAAEDLDLDELPFDLCELLEEAGKTARLYGNSFVFLLGASPNQPRPEDAEITGALVLDRYEVSPYSYYSDWKKPNFGDVEYYELHPDQPDGGSQTSFPRVHESHLLRFTGQKLTRRLRNANNGFDDSVLEAAFNSIRNFVSTEQAMASIVQRFETSTIAIAGLAEAQSIPDGTDLVQRRMQLALQSLSLLNAMLVDADAGESYTRTYATVAGLDTLWDRFAHSLAKAFGYPMTKLFGMSPSGQSTDDESGRANWAKIVSSYRSKELTPAIRVICRQVNGGKPVTVKWKPVDEATLREQAENDLAHAQAEDMRIKNGTIHRLEVREKLLDAGYVPEGEEPDDPAEVQLEHARIQNQMAAEAPAQTGNEPPQNGENGPQTGNEPPPPEE